MSSPPGQSGFTSTRDLYALVNAMDDAANDARRWPAVASKLAVVLPLDPADIPQEFPSSEEAVMLLARAAVSAWSAEQVELLEFVCERLARVAAVHHKLAISELTQRAATKALNHSLRAIALVDVSAKLLARNVWADQIFQQNDGLGIRGEYLRGTISNDDVQLRHSIEIVSRRKFRWVAQSIARTRTPELLNLVMAPANAFMRSDDREDMIVITITSRCRKLTLDPDILMHMYGLTRSEANIACCLAAGDTIEQAAEAMTVSTNTARTHLKRIFMKTETNRQSQLVLLLLQHTNATNVTPVAANSHAEQPSRSRSDRRLQLDRPLWGRDVRSMA